MAARMGYYSSTPGLSYGQERRKGILANQLLKRSDAADLDRELEKKRQRGVLGAARIRGAATRDATGMSVAGAEKRNTATIAANAPLRSAQARQAGAAATESGYQSAFAKYGLGKAKKEDAALEAGRAEGIARLGRETKKASIYEGLVPQVEPPSLIGYIMDSLTNPQYPKRKKTPGFIDSISKYLPQ